MPPAGRESRPGGPQEAAGGGAEGLRMGHHGEEPRTDFTDRPTASSTSTYSTYVYMPPSIYSSTCIPAEDVAVLLLPPPGADTNTLQ